MNKQWKKIHNKKKKTTDNNMTPTDGQAPSAARTPADTVLTDCLPCLYVALLFEGLIILCR